MKKETICSKISENQLSISYTKDIYTYWLEKRNSYLKNSANYKFCTDRIKEAAQILKDLKRSNTKLNTILNGKAA